MILESLTPRQIVAQLDKYIVGQKDAKRAVSIALRNRWRRQQVDPSMKDEIIPKNIIMIGTTGVGKTEIARRLAKLANSPFMKIEASKFTEVGYVGRDVESIIRDLTEIGIKMVREEERLKVKAKAAETAKERILDILVPPPPPTPAGAAGAAGTTVEMHPVEGGAFEPAEQAPDHNSATREKFREMLDTGKLDSRSVEIDVAESQGGGFPGVQVFSNVGNMEEIDSGIREMLGNFLPKKSKRRKMKVADALKYIEQEESARLIDNEYIKAEAVSRVEQNGIVFLDEIDKIASGNGKSQGPDVSREGVQRDLLPIVEGTTVSTKYGTVNTEHILFIAAGAFHVSKPSDLIPELQGRFPIRVELSSLTEADFIRILVEPSNSLIKQYVELMRTEKVELKFDDSGIKKIAEIATEVNANTENIGARRLHTILEKVLDDVSFDADTRAHETVVIDADYVDTRLKDIVKNRDLTRFIL